MAQLVIVEDDMITALALQRAVTRMGHQVAARASSAAEAMAAVQAYRPDVVLLDIRLRGTQDGVLVGTDIQALWSIPVIYLSGLDSSQLGIPEFPEALWCALTKPIDWEQLRDILAHLFPPQPPRHDALVWGQGDPRHPLRRTAEELREPLRQLRAKAGALPRRSHFLQPQPHAVMATTPNAV